MGELYGSSDSQVNRFGPDFRSAPLLTLIFVKVAAHSTLLLCEVSASPTFGVAIVTVTPFPTCVQLVGVPVAVL